MMRKLTAALLALLLLAGVSPASGKDGPAPPPAEMPDDLIVQSDYVGPAVNGQMPDFGGRSPGGVSYMLMPDGTSVILWASSSEGLDEGDTSLWTGTLTAHDLTAVRQYVANAAASVIYCTVWAGDPWYDHELNAVRATGHHWCTGAWTRHRLVGKMMRQKWWIVWIIEDTYDTHWEYDETWIEAYVLVDCNGSKSTKWRMRATGTVQWGDSNSDTKSHNSENPVTMDCSP